MRSILLSLSLTCSLAAANDYVIAPSGGDFSSIQAALDAAGPGDRLLLREKVGGWKEKVVFTHGGSASGGWLELRAYPGDAPAIDGAGVSGEWMIEIHDKDWIKIVGLELRNNLNTQGDGSAIRLHGMGTHYEFRDNVIHDMRGADSMAITVYGTSLTGSISDLVIDGNTVYDCEPAHSEAITLNGNVERFEVTNNLVRDVNNIAIDCIGGESSINSTYVARDGVVRGNVVLRANSSYGGGYAGGIYVDGGQDIVVEGNYVSGCDLGIEVGAENHGFDSTGIVVRNNTVVANEKGGIVFGGYDSSVGRTRNSAFVNNLLYRNDSLATGVGEVWVQWAKDCVIANNVVSAGNQRVWVYSDSTTSGLVFDHNLYHVPSGTGRFEWGGTVYSGLASWQGTGRDLHSDVGDPLFTQPTGQDGVLGTPDDDFRVLAGSPAIDAGDNAQLDPLMLADYAGGPRFASDVATVASGMGLPPIVDRGATEYVSAAVPILRFCESTPNSVGAGAWIGWSGTPSVSANQFRIEARGLPAQQFGLFFFGANEAHVPSGNGVVCVGPTLFRLPVVKSNTAGAVGHTLDLTAPPALGRIVPGSTWRFQHWTRDTAGGGAGWDFSDALLVTFLP